MLLENTQVCDVRRELSEKEREMLQKREALYQAESETKEAIALLHFMLKPDRDLGLSFRSTLANSIAKICMDRIVSFRTMEAGSEK